MESPAMICCLTGAAASSRGGAWAQGLRRGLWASLNTCSLLTLLGTSIHQEGVKGEERKQVPCETRGAAPTQQPTVLATNSVPCKLDSSLLRYPQPLLKGSTPNTATTETELRVSQGTNQRQNRAALTPKLHSHPTKQRLKGETHTPLFKLKTPALLSQERIKNTPKLTK